MPSASLRLRPILKGIAAVTAFAFTVTTLLPVGWAAPQPSQDRLRGVQGYESSEVEAGLEEALRDSRVVDHSVRPEQAVHPSIELRMNGASKDPIVEPVSVGNQNFWQVRAGAPFVKELAQVGLEEAPGTMPRRQFMGRGAQAAAAAVVAGAMALGNPSLPAQAPPAGAAPTASVWKPRLANVRYPFTPRSENRVLQRYRTGQLLVPEPVFREPLALQHPPSLLEALRGEWGTLWEGISNFWQGFREMFTSIGWELGLFSSEKIPTPAEMMERTPGQLGPQKPVAAENERPEATHSYVIWGSWLVKKKWWPSIWAGLRRAAGYQADDLLPQGHPHSFVYLDAAGLVTPRRTDEVRDWLERLYGPRNPRTGQFDQPELGAVAHGIQIVPLFGDPLMAAAPGEALSQLRQLWYTGLLVPGPDGVVRVAFDIEPHAYGGLKGYYVRRDPNDPDSKIVEIDWEQAAYYWENVFLIAQKAQEGLDMALKSPWDPRPQYAEVTLFVPPHLVQVLERSGIKVPPGVKLMFMAYSNTATNTEGTGMLDRLQAVRTAAGVGGVLEGVNWGVIGNFGLPTGDEKEGESFWNQEDEARGVGKALDEGLIQAPGFVREYGLHFSDFWELKEHLMQGVPSPEDRAAYVLTMEAKTASRILKRLGDFLLGATEWVASKYGELANARGANDHARDFLTNMGHRLGSGMFGAGSIAGHYDTVLGTVLHSYALGKFQLHFNRDTNFWGPDYGLLYAGGIAGYASNFGIGARMTQVTRIAVDPSKGDLIQLPNGEWVKGKVVSWEEDILSDGMTPSRASNEEKVTHLDSNGYDLYYVITVENSAQIPNERGDLVPNKEFSGNIRIQFNTGWGMEPLQQESGDIKLEPGQATQAVVRLLVGHDQFGTLTDPASRKGENPAKRIGRLQADAVVQEAIYLINTVPQSPEIADEAGLPGTDPSVLLEQIHPPLKVTEQGKADLREGLRKSVVQAIQRYSLSPLSTVALDKDLAVYVSLKAGQDPTEVVGKVVGLKERHGITHLAVEAQDLLDLVKRFQEILEQERSSDEGTRLRLAKDQLIQEGHPALTTLRGLLKGCREQGLHPIFLVDWKSTGGDPVRFFQVLKILKEVQEFRLNGFARLAIRNAPSPEGAGGEGLAQVLRLSLDAPSSIILLGNSEGSVQVGELKVEICREVSADTAEEVLTHLERDREEAKAKKRPLGMAFLTLDQVGRFEASPAQADRLTARIVETTTRQQLERWMSDSWRFAPSVRRIVVNHLKIRKLAALTTGILSPVAQEFSPNSSRAFMILSSVWRLDQAEAKAGSIPVLPGETTSQESGAWAPWDVQTTNQDPGAYLERRRIIPLVQEVRFPGQVQGVALAMVDGRPVALNRGVRTAFLVGDEKLAISEGEGRRSLTIRETTFNWRRDPSKNLIVWREGEPEPASANVLRKSEESMTFPVSHGLEIKVRLEEPQKVVTVRMGDKTVQVWEVEDQEERSTSVSFYRLETPREAPAPSEGTPAPIHSPVVREASDKVTPYSNPREFWAKLIFWGLGAYASLTVLGRLIQRFGESRRTEQANRHIQETEGVKVRPDSSVAPMARIQKFFWVTGTTLGAVWLLSLWGPLKILLLGPSWTGLSLGIKLFVGLLLGSRFLHGAVGGGVAPQGWKKLPEKVQKAVEIGSRWGTALGWVSLLGTAWFKLLSPWFAAGGFKALFGFKPVAWLVASAPAWTAALTPYAVPIAAVTAGVAVVGIAASLFWRSRSRAPTVRSEDRSRGAQTGLEERSLLKSLGRFAINFGWAATVVVAMGLGFLGWSTLSDPSALGKFITDLSSLDLFKIFSVYLMAGGLAQGMAGMARRRVEFQERSSSTFRRLLASPVFAASMWGLSILQPAFAPLSILFAASAGLGFVTRLMPWTQTLLVGKKKSEEGMPPSLAALGAPFLAVEILKGLPGLLKTISTPILGSTAGQWLSDVVSASYTLDVIGYLVGFGFATWLGLLLWRKVAIPTVRGLVRILPEFPGLRAVKQKALATVEPLSKDWILSRSEREARIAVTTRSDDARDFFSDPSHARYLGSHTSLDELVGKGTKTQILLASQELQRWLIQNDVTEAIRLAEGLNSDRRAALIKQAEQMVTQGSAATDSGQLRLTEAELREIERQMVTLQATRDADRFLRDHPTQATHLGLAANQGIADLAKDKDKREAALDLLNGFARERQRAEFMVQLDFGAELAHGGFRWNPGQMIRRLKIDDRVGGVFPAIYVFPTWDYNFFYYGVGLITLPVLQFSQGLQYVISMFWRLVRGREYGSNVINPMSGHIRSDMETRLFGFVMEVQGRWLMGHLYVMMEALGGRTFHWDPDALKPATYVRSYDGMRQVISSLFGKSDYLSRAAAYYACAPELRNTWYGTGKNAIFEQINRRVWNDKPEEGPMSDSDAFGPDFEQGEPNVWGVRILGPHGNYLYTPFSIDVKGGKIVAGKTPAKFDVRFPYAGTPTKAYWVGVALSILQGFYTTRPEIRSDGTVAWVPVTPARDFVPEFEKAQEEVEAERQRQAQATRGRYLNAADWTTMEGNLQRRAGVSAGLEETVSKKKVKVAVALPPELGHGPYQGWYGKFLQGVVRVTDYLTLKRWEFRGPILMKPKAPDPDKAGFLGAGWNFVHGFLMEFFGFLIPDQGELDRLLTRKPWAEDNLPKGVPNQVPITPWRIIYRMGGPGWIVGLPLFVLSNLGFLAVPWAVSLGLMVLSRFVLESGIRTFLPATYWGFRQTPIISGIKAHYHPKESLKLAQEAVGGSLETPPKGMRATDHGDLIRDGYRLLESQPALLEEVVKYSKGLSGERFMENPRVPERRWEWVMAKKVKGRLRKVNRNERDRMAVEQVILAMIVGERMAIGNRMVQDLYVGSHDPSVMRGGEENFRFSIGGGENLPSLRFQQAARILGTPIIRRRSWGSYTEAAYVGGVRLPSQMFIDGQDRLIDRDNDPLCLLVHSTIVDLEQVISKDGKLILVSDGLAPEINNIKLEAIFNLAGIKPTDSKSTDPRLKEFKLDGYELKSFDDVQVVKAAAAPNDGEPLARRVDPVEAFIKAPDGLRAGKGIYDFFAEKSYLQPDMDAIARTEARRSVDWIRRLSGGLEELKLSPEATTSGTLVLGDNHRRIAWLDRILFQASHALDEEGKGWMRFNRVLGFMGSLGLGGGLAWGALAIAGFTNPFGMAAAALFGFVGLVAAVSSLANQRADTFVWEMPRGDGVRAWSLIPGLVIKWLPTIFLDKLRHWVGGRVNKRPQWRNTLRQWGLSWLMEVPWSSDIRKICAVLQIEPEAFQGFVHDLDAPYLVGSTFFPGMPILRLKVGVRSGTKRTATRIPALVALRLAKEVPWIRILSGFNYIPSDAWDIGKAFAEDTLFGWIMAYSDSLAPKTPAVSIQRLNYPFHRNEQDRDEQGAFQRAMQFYKGMDLAKAHQELAAEIRGMDPSLADFLEVLHALRAFQHDEVSTGGGTGAGVYAYQITGDTAKRLYARLAGFVGVYAPGEIEALVNYLIFERIDQILNGALARQLEQMNLDEGTLTGSNQIQPGQTLADPAVKARLFQGTFTDPRAALALVKAQMGDKKLSAQEFTPLKAQGNQRLTTKRDVTQLKVRTVKSIDFLFLSWGGRYELKVTDDHRHLRAVNDILRKYGKTNVIVLYPDIMDQAQLVEAKPLGTPPDSPTPLPAPERAAPLRETPGEEPAIVTEADLLPEEPSETAAVPEPTRVVEGGMEEPRPSPQTGLEEPLLAKQLSALEEELSGTATLSPEGIGDLNRFLRENTVVREEIPVDVAIRVKWFQVQFQERLFREAVKRLSSVGGWYVTAESTTPVVFLLDDPKTVPWAPLIAQVGAPVAVITQTLEQAQGLQWLLQEAGIPTERYAVEALEMHGWDRALALKTLEEEFRQRFHTEVALQQIPPATSLVEVEAFLRKKGVLFYTEVSSTLKDVERYLASLT